ncbi:MAG: aminotransferase class I/II-fold pyridoxal phosphate-dependent enzyme [Myxococcota bacterium]
MSILRKVEQENGVDLGQVRVRGGDTVKGFYDAIVRVSQSILNAEEATRRPLTVRRPALYIEDDPLVSAQTLVEMVHLRAAETPDAVGIRFSGEELTYRSLSSSVIQVAHALRAQGVTEGDRVILVMPNSLWFFPLFYGVQQLRATAVPVYHVPQPDRIARIATHCDAKVIVTLRPLARPIKRRLKDALAPASILTLEAERLLGAPVDTSSPLPSPLPDDLAMLQYTSGTTGDAKGVMLTQSALITNVRQTIVGTLLDSNDVFVSWLPVYHDLGLIYMTMCPIYLGARLELLPVSLDADRWLSTITTARGTVTAAPDFAYRFVLRTCPDPAPYDLSSLKLALVAAEPVRARTIERFEARFQIPGVMRPGYGLAEASVGVCFYPPNAGPIIVDESGNVSAGSPLPEIALDIRDIDGRPMRPGQIGEICLSSPAQTLGYLNNPQATARLFFPDGRVRTGDLGYLDRQGRLFIVDRLKNIIIVGGRTVSPREIEEIADGLPEVRLSMAVGVDEGGDLGEQIHLIVEANVADPLLLSRELMARVEADLGIRPAKVHVTPPSTIPRTYNGKLRYPEMRQRLGDARPREGLKMAQKQAPVTAPDRQDFFRSRRVHLIDAQFQKGIAMGLCHNQLDPEQKLDGRTFQLKGRTFVNFASCSYLGLETDPQVKQGIIEATCAHGSSFIMSRAYASSPSYQRFADKLQEMMGAPVVVTPSTTLGSMSFMQVFINPGDLLLLDESVHNSVQLAASTTLQHGCEIKTVPHNDIQALEVILEAHRDADRRIWYCADGIYSMFGDLCPIHTLRELMDRYPNFYSYIDDAHGMSVHGERGRGYVLGEQETLHPKMIVAVSLSKSFGMGCGGALVLPNEAWRRMFRTTGPAMIFSTPVPPPMLGAGLVLADMHLSDALPGLQAALMERLAILRDACEAAGLENIADPRSPIQYILVGSDEHAAAVAARVLDEGWFINLAQYPAVAPGQAGLRLVIHNRLTRADLVGVVEAITRAKQALSQSTAK